VRGSGDGGYVVPRGGPGLTRPRAPAAVVTCPPMRRLARRLFTLCSAVSLLMCVRLAGVWIASYHRPADEEWVARAASGDRRPSGYRGGFEIGRLYPARPTTTSSWAYRWVGDGSVADLRPRRVVWRRAGIEEHEGRFIPRDGWRAMNVAGDRLPTYGRWGADRVADAPREPVTEVPYRVWRVPYWVPFVLLAALPLCWLSVLLRNRLRDADVRKGRCTTCGYDLRASPERCPECGTAAAAASPA
jgi:hypothetical protein